MSTITKEDLLKTDPALKNRPYQLDALLSIFLYLKCLVKMFCGTGKSRIITNVIIHAKKNLSVIVFPSLALINQYSADYLNNDEFLIHFKKHKAMNVSTEKLDDIHSTTDPKEIKKFLKLKSSKIILVTYQSYEVLLKCLDGQKIGLVCYDEAHHVTSPECQKLVFNTDYFEKEVFFTATPKNENGITMFDRDDPTKNMCGPVAFDYTYLQGLNENMLNAFEVRIDMYTKNTNASIYEAMARAILTKSTNRVLSFHSGVNGKSNTNVWNFVKESEFKTAFIKVQENEFPEKAGYYKKITFMGMDGYTPPSERKAMLKALDNTPNNEIYIISSCETLCEGVDTKKANMCVFADPKSSIYKIIQNIGRVLRRNIDCPLSSILIPCFVNMENYASANGDRVKQDELIREQMRSEKGDYVSIQNVLAALRQEDPEMCEMCLNYPNRKMKEASLTDQGFQIAYEADDEEETYTAETVEKMKTDGEPLEIHTNETVERFNEESPENMKRLYHDEEEGVYKPIVRCSTSETDEDESDPESDSESDETDADDRQIIEPPVKQQKRINMSIHQNADIQMLWGVKGELDFSKKFCSVVIECEVTKVDQMEVAIGIVERAKAREADGKNLLPKYKKSNNTEFNDASKLQQWKQFLKGNKTTHKLQDKVKIYLDTSLNGWRDDFDKKAMKDAIEIVTYINSDKLKGELPKTYQKKLDENGNDKRTPEQLKETGYAGKLLQWRKNLSGNAKGRCSVELRNYLDTEIPGWNNNLEEVALGKAKNIVERSIERMKTPDGHLLPKNYKGVKNDIISNQESEDAMILGMWKESSKGRGSSNLYERVKKYLDEHLKGWCDEYSPLNQAKEIVARAIKRKDSGGQLLPKDYRIPKSLKTQDLLILKKIEESQDASNLHQWSNYIKDGSATSICPDDVLKYLDKELPGWNSTLDEDAMKHVVELIKRAKIRKSKGGKLLPTRHDKKTEPDNRPDNDKQEDKDAKRLKNLSNSLSGKAKGRCSDYVRDLLDKELPGWREPGWREPNKRTKKQTALPIATASIEAQTTPHHFPSPSAIGVLHKTYLRMRSDTLHQKFKTEPQLWRDYHATRKQTFTTYDPASIPANRIIQELEKIQTKRQKVVIDMGCGEASIAHHFLAKNDPRFTFQNYDHQSGGDSRIQEVDISALPLEDASVEIAIMSLALWGTQDNCIQYLKEAYRVLESGGKFYISDSTKKWSPEPMTAENGGELLRTLLTENGFKIINEDIGLPFCLFVCNKIY